MMENICINDEQRLVQKEWTWRFIGGTEMLQTRAIGGRHIVICMNNEQW